VDYALSSIIGERDNQEDYGLITGPTPSGAVLAVIADGMGGQVAGEIASSSAVKSFVESFSSNKSRNLPLRLNVALDKANRTLAKSTAGNPNLHGMGATLIAAHVDPLGLSWISVGDSILYLYRDKKLHRLNDDHSMMPVIQDSVRRGKITDEEARIHPHRNALRSALTGEDIPLVDLREEAFRLKKGDLILLATDGILTLSELEISQTLDACQGQTAKAIADRLLATVRQQNKPRQDNTLVEVIKVSGPGRAPWRWSGAVVAASMLVMTSFMALMAFENRDAIFRAVGVTAIRQETPASTAPSGEAKVTPISLEESQRTLEKKPDSHLTGAGGPTLAASSPVTEPAPKGGKPSANDKRSTVTTRSGKTIESEAIVRTDTSQPMAPPARLPSASAAKPAVVAASETARSPAKAEAESRDGERAKQLLDSDHTGNSKSAADGKE
jgi:serine/threonine protein phosphatase PrpC